MENSGQNERVIQLSGNPIFGKFLFFTVLTGYCLYYAPFGINETDGGFLTGLGWQILNGKALYGDVVYVRPPLPVWLRMLELQFLPEQWAVLGERWIFYLKVALYSWLGAAILTGGARRWLPATFGFIISVHCYPPMAWHTVDGILCSVLGIWCLVKIPQKWGAIPAGIFVFAAMLCKQSFYPMAAVFVGLLFFDFNFPKVKNFRKVGLGTATLLFCSILFLSYLYSNHLFESYFRMTGGSASGGQALQHGLVDYFRIKPVLALISAILLLPVAWSFWKRNNQQMTVLLWVMWLTAMAGSYVIEIWSGQTFTVPFAQTRLLFWAGLLFCALRFTSSDHHPSLAHHSSLITHQLSLLAVSWCASVSWGYNLPVLFATPWVFAVLQISRYLWQRAYPRMPLNGVNVAALVILLAVFRYSYEFVYRDGRRSEMNTHLGQVFPALHGIYSTPGKGRLYLDLKKLAARYPNFKTLPAIPQASFLTKTYPPLPLDWVVNRETNGDNSLVSSALGKNKPVLFIEKTWAKKIQTDPELSFTRDLLQTGVILEETAYFWVVQSKY